MLESNKQVFQKRKHTELLVAGFWKPAVPHLVLNPGVGTLLEGKYGNPRVLNAIYTLIEHTYLSTTNSKQSVIKHQSQERVKKSKKKTCLQPQLVKSYVAKVLPFHFFWHSLLLIFLLFPSFSHVNVQWVSFHFFVVLMYHLLWWSQLFVPCWVVTFSLF